MRPTPSIVLSGLIAMTALLVSSCLITYDTDGVTLQEADDGTPRLIVIEPRPNQVMGELLQVRLDLRNFRLIDPDVDSDGTPDRENVEFEGHLYVTVDDNPVAPWVFETAFAIRLNTLEDTADNQHTLRIEVRNNDQSVFEGIAPVVVQFFKGDDAGGSGQGSGSGG